MWSRKKVYYSSCSEMMDMDISGVTKESKHFITNKDIVAIEE